MNPDHSGIQKSIQTENQKEGERDVKARTQIPLQAIHQYNVAATLCLPLFTLASLAFLPQDFCTCCSIGLEHFSPTILPVPALLS